MAKLSRKAFIAKLAPIVQQVRREGSPMFPSVRLAQNVLETGGVIHPWNNLGGIKVGGGSHNAYWRGGVVHKGTWEVYDGKRVDIQAAFRAYDTLYDFYMDQDLLFRLPRYERVRRAATPEAQAEMLQACGYATDPNYARKLISIIRDENLRFYDEVEEEWTVSEKQAMEAKLQRLEQRLHQLEQAHDSAVPTWAQGAVDAAVKQGIIETPVRGSYDFYRMLAVVHRSQMAGK
ncbi:glycoside hydrolase family 73 protein [Paenibacillus sp. 1P07SE]|uniref:glycoside hydrolase family 73 protein n=1 Tax=Paenibacillus sp. 1P07SE TaxID=3132209 RepID=UPI0039A42D38